MEPADARRVWQALEPYHALVYFAAEAREAYAAAGLKGFWMGYFASRAAAMGPVPAEVVVATFFNFHPRLVHRAIPDAWGLASPAAVLAARYAAIDGALQRVVGDALDTPAVAEAAELARAAARAADPAGRALVAGHAAMPWPAPPHLALWHAATLLREYRGDGHVAALLAAGLDGRDAHITFAGTGTLPAEVLQSSRGYTDEEWAEGAERLRARGLLDGDGRLTEAGKALRADVERRTDEVAVPAFDAIGDGGVARLVELVRPLSARIVAEGGVPVPNPMGAPKP